MFTKDIQKQISQNNIFHINPIPIIQPNNNHHITLKFSQAKSPSGCANKLCKNHLSQNKLQSYQISAETLCTRCKQQFQKDSFCIYCKQIYFDQTDDGKQWIMCQQCTRWVHSQCADFNTRQNPNAQFQCIKCKKIESIPNGRRNIPRAGYAKLQKKKNSQFLNSIGFEWQLASHEISQDMQTEGKQQKGVKLDQKVFIERLNQMILYKKIEAIKIGIKQIGLKNSYKLRVVVLKQ